MGSLYGWVGNTIDDCDRKSAPENHQINAKISTTTDERLGMEIRIARTQNGPLHYTDWDDDFGRESIRYSIFYFYSIHREWIL